MFPLENLAIPCSKMGVKKPVVYVQEKAAHIGPG